MDFGMIDYENITTETVQLPVTATKLYFTESTNRPSKIYFGLPKWVDGLPAGIKEKNALDEYVKTYNAIELNATHYKIYPEEKVIAWKNKPAGHGFLYCPKMYKGIANYGLLTNKDVLLDAFIKSVSLLEDHLGPILIQLPENFGPERKDELIEFLEKLPNGSQLQFFLEVRHTGWFENEKIKNQLFLKLNELNVGAVITDTPGRRDVLHMNFPIAKAFVRFSCKGCTDIDLFRLSQWKKYLAYLISLDINEIYFFLHISIQEDSLSLAQEIQVQLNELLS